MIQFFFYVISIVNCLRPIPKRSPNLLNAVQASVGWTYISKMKLTSQNICVRTVCNEIKVHLEITVFVIMCFFHTSPTYSKLG